MCNSIRSRVHFLLRVFDSLLVGCVGVGRQRQLATWRTFKKVDKANRYGARSGCRRGSQLSATARRGDCFPALHITPPLEEGREPSGRTEAVDFVVVVQRARRSECGRLRPPSLPIRCGASAPPLPPPVAAAASGSSRQANEPRWMRSAPLGGRIVVWGHGWRNAVLLHCCVHFKSIGLPDQV